MAFTISLFYAGLLGLILIPLSFRVVLLRRRHQVGIGVGENRALELAVRTHGNFCEYVPFGILLLLVLEASAALSPVVLHGLGVTLIVGRVLHGFFGLNRSAGASKGRFVGTLLTWMMIASSALLAISMALGRWFYTVA